MVKLIFNTTVKTVTVESISNNIGFNAYFDGVSTVRVQDGHYEVIQKDEFEKTYPVARFPIANTVMFIQR